MTETCLRVGSGVSVAEAVVWSALFLALVAFIPVTIWSVNKWTR